ncbi:MAG: hypothetical protein JWL82_317 [Parcubacteria group bacterium]|nr:hypothetical protein [Parcubacteria group bacterium]
MEVELEPGERVMRAVRKHWFVLAITLIPFALLAWLPTLFLPFLKFISNAVPHTGSISTVTFVANPLFRLAYGLWLIVLWSAAFNTITRYYLNEWVITTTRIISIHQYGFFSREVSSLLLARVQDVNTDVEGLFGTLIGYGQLEVQSAGTEEHFIMDDIANPQGLRDLIMSEIAALHEGTAPTAVSPLEKLAGL